MPCRIWRSIRPTRKVTAPKWQTPPLNITANPASAQELGLQPRSCKTQGRSVSIALARFLNPLARLSLHSFNERQLWMPYSCFHEERRLSPGVGVALLDSGGGADVQRKRPHSHHRLGPGPERVHPGGVHGQRGRRNCKSPRLPRGRRPSHLPAVQTRPLRHPVQITLPTTGLHRPAAPAGCSALKQTNKKGSHCWYICIWVSESSTWGGGKNSFHTSFTPLSLQKFHLHLSGIKKKLDIEMTPARVVQFFSVVVVNVLFLLRLILFLCYTAFHWVLLKQFASSCCVLHFKIHEICVLFL